MSFDPETLVLTPASAPPVAFDLGDIDTFTPADYELTLTLYTGGTITLRQFGKAFQNLSHDLLDAYRQRLVQCLLLEDLEEITRFDGDVQLRPPAAPGWSPGGPAELRIYRSNLAVLPAEAAGFQWRLAEINTVAFDESSYTATLESAAGSLRVSKLARRTREFCDRLQECIFQINEKSVQVLHRLFPFLSPDQFQAVAGLMKEGHAAPLAQAGRIHPKIESALVTEVVDTRLKPYFDELAAHAVGGIYSGFKFIREEDEKSGAHGGESSEETQSIPPDVEDGEAVREESQEPILHWFFFPLAPQPGAARPKNLLAWEATSKMGRATYFFRLVSPEQSHLLKDPALVGPTIGAAIQKLNRALVLLNFRREPIYLPDDTLLAKPRHRRYAIACRKLPELRRLRASFLGRAIHTTPEAWSNQLKIFLTEGDE